MGVMDKFLLLPKADNDSARYWKCLREHQAHLQKCVKCARFRFPPYPSCPHCGTLGGEWRPISGRGTIYSWVVIHHPVDARLATEVPFTVVLVELEEGPRVIGRLVGSGGNQTIGNMPVRTRYDDMGDELTLLNFEP
jgi:hypothetical protein